MCSDDEVVEAVAVHVTRARHRSAGKVLCVDAVQPEAGRAVERAEVHCRAEPT